MDDDIISLLLLVRWEHFVHVDKDCVSIVHCDDQLQKIPLFLSARR